MSIIAVSEEVFSGGREFAKGLAKRLGIRYVDSAVLVERAAAWGGQPKRLRAAFEHAPTFLDRFIRGRERQVSLLQAALAEDIRDGNAVCYGVAADLLNVDCKQILRIRVQASHGLRRLRVEELLRFTRVEAERYLRKSDRKQGRWHMYLYGGKAGLPLGHDLLINLEQTSPEENYTTVSDMINYQGRFRPNMGDQALLERFAVSTRIKAAIAQDPQTAHLDIDVEMQGDTAVLQGVVRGIDDIIALQLVPSPLPSIAIDVSQVRLGGADYLPPFFPAGGGREPAAQKKSGFRLPALPRPAWLLAGVAAMVLLVIAASHAPGRWFRPANTPLQSFAGVITDSQCGISHKVVQKTAECVRVCVKLTGAKYVLNDGTHSFVLTDQQTADRFAAQRVVATGRLDEITGDVQLSSIHAVSR